MTPRRKTSLGPPSGRQRGVGKFIRDHKEVFIKFFQLHRDEGETAHQMERRWPKFLKGNWPKDEWVQAIKFSTAMNRMVVDRLIQPMVVVKPGIKRPRKKKEDIKKELQQKQQSQQAQEVTPSEPPKEPEVQKLALPFPTEDEVVRTVLTMVEEALTDAKLNPREVLIRIQVLVSKRRF